MELFKRFDGFRQDLIAARSACVGDVLAGDLIGLEFDAGALFVEGLAFAVGGTFEVGHAGELVAVVEAEVDARDLAADGDTVSAEGVGFNTSDVDALEVEAALDTALDGDGAEFAVELGEAGGLFGGESASGFLGLEGLAFGGFGVPVSGLLFEAFDFGEFGGVGLAALLFSLFAQGLGLGAGVGGLAQDDVDVDGTHINVFDVAAFAIDDVFYFQAAKFEVDVEVFGEGGADLFGHACVLFGGVEDGVEGSDVAHIIVEGFDNRGEYFEDTDDKVTDGFEGACAVDGGGHGPDAFAGDEEVM